MASDEHVTVALAAFAEDIRRNSRIQLEAPGLLTLAQADIRRRRLEELADEAEVLAANPRAATYQGFEKILQQVQELGTSPARELIIAVASAFMQRPHIIKRR